MRYLSYDFRGDGIYELELDHPEYLVSLSMQRLQLFGLGKCVNLRNLYSNICVFESEDLVALKNLRRIRSRNDEYTGEGGPSFLEDVFKERQLEYVYMYNKEYDSNVVSSVTLQGSLRSLRFFYIYYSQEPYNIAIDLTNTIHDSLRVFYVHTYDDDTHNYGTLQGDEERVNLVT